MYEFARKGERLWNKKRKEEIRKSIIACDNDIVKLRSQAENLEEIIKNQKCTQKRFESECDKYGKRSIFQR